MDLSEYIAVVTAQMRCKRARAMVAKELADHIADQKQAYVETGMDEASAELAAVRQMGTRWRWAERWTASTGPEWM